MEKIYIEEKQKNNKKLHLSVSVGLSFAVAFVAMFSILFISLSGTSYAAPNMSATLPTTFTTGEDEYFIGSETPSGSVAYSVPIFTAQNVDTPIFCVESLIEFATNTKYVREGEIKDEGFIYLLTKLEALNVKDSDISENSSNPYVTTNNPYSKADVVKTWIEQTAIWAYLGRTQGYNPSRTRDDYKASGVVTTLAGINKIIFQYSPTQETLGELYINGSTFYNKYGVADIVNTAISYYNTTTLLTVSAKKNGTAFTETNGYMKSSKIDVTISTTGGIAQASNTYKISLGNAPAGTKLYGLNGNKEEEITNLNAVDYTKYKSFYIYVPKNKITETITFSVTVNGSFDVYTGYYYKPDNAAAGQHVITVDTVEKSKPANLEFTLAPAPDTGVNISKLMYIVGMIVLLSGLGILYVNIKNQKQYQ